MSCPASASAQPWSENCWCRHALQNDSASSYCRSAPCSTKAAGVERGLRPLEPIAVRLGPPGRRRRACAASRPAAATRSAGRRAGRPRIRQSDGPSRRSDPVRRRGARAVPARRRRVREPRTHPRATERPDTPDPTVHASSTRSLRRIGESVVHISLEVEDSVAGASTWSARRARCVLFASPEPPTRGAFWASNAVALRSGCSPSPCLPHGSRVVSHTSSASEPHFGAVLGVRIWSCTQTPMEKGLENDHAEDWYDR